MFRLRVYMTNSNVYVSTFNSQQELLAAIRGFSSNPNVLRMDSE